MKSLLILSLLLLALRPAQADLRVPAFTAYVLPNPGGVSVSERDGVTHWTNPQLSLNWYGHFSQTGQVTAKIAVRLPKNTVSKLQLSVAGQSHQTQVIGAGDATPVTADFGGFDLTHAGYQQFALFSLNENGQSAGDLDMLILDGPAAKDAQFNLETRRNAASVHLIYSPSDPVKVAAFYCEVTSLEDPPATYYMACGWHRGYLGMQVNSKTERRIIFSVWDSGDEAMARAKVAGADRVQLIAKGEGVEAGDFGHEGTGGHSHFIYLWKTGEKQKFLVTAKPVDATHTIYSGYYFHPEKKAWMLLSSWKAPKDGGYLRHLYSFSEDFNGDNGNLRRKALYGNQWIRDDAGKWLELTTASFSHDANGKSNRLDRFMGVGDGQFFLSQGGFVDGFTRYGEKFSRPAVGVVPTALTGLPRNILEN
ncbi:MAG TPA: DUF3472 domain-containing protein [Verrucomicrobiae bacterium]|jgi:hypothetical protein|nr:DUF3472 domain-containing protein [Verrucomicrobiae bacterium]